MGSIHWQVRMHTVSLLEVGVCSSQPEWRDDLARELDGIGKVLVDRMRNEESRLYPPYGPP